MIFLVRGFLSDYRGNMVGVFKRAAGLNLASQQGQSQSFLGGASVLSTKEDQELMKAVDQCLKAYTGLAIGCGFLDFEEERGVGGNGIASNGGLGRSYYNGGGFT